MSEAGSTDSHLDAALLPGGSEGGSPGASETSGSAEFRLDVFTTDEFEGDDRYRGHTHRPLHPVHPHVLAT